MRPDSRLSATFGPFAIVVALSFVPFLFKAVDYLLIGSYIPMAVFAALAGLVTWGIWLGHMPARWAIRTWAIVLILWALARLGLMILFAVTSVSEAAIEARLNLGFALVSLAFLALGVVLFRSAALINR